MSNLILELFSEEIPAKIQLFAVGKAEEILGNKLSNGLDVKNITVKGYITPRRVALDIQNLPAKITVPKISVRGPKSNASDNAINGFLKKHNLTSKDDLIIKDVKKEQYYFYESKELKLPIAEIIPEILEDFIKDFAKIWPKTMRWGDYRIKWIRPLRNILCILDDQVINVTYGHLKSNNTTCGHRFLSKKKPIKIANYEQYFSELEKNFVMLDHQIRKDKILKSLKSEAQKLNLHIVEDEELLDEVTGLVEYPIILCGEIERKFLYLPEEVLITTVKNHQKYFCLKGDKNKLRPYFLFVSNNDTSNNDELISGNQKVLSARLEDAKYFYETDIKTKLEDRAVLLEKIIFHKNIGDMRQKVDNTTILAKFIAVWVPDSHLADVEFASKLSKMDLTTEMVSELPELQGIMGYYYAQNEGIDLPISAAIKDHYLPRGVQDLCPEEPISISISLADKIDSLVSLILVNEYPTGSKDPYALRRLAIGIIRIILHNKLNIPLQLIIERAINNYPLLIKKRKNFYPDIDTKNFKHFIKLRILEFLIDRFKTILRDNDISYDVINAVFDSGNEDDILKIYKKSQYLSSVINTEDGNKIVSAYRRAYKIYHKAEQEDGVSYNKRPYYLVLKSEPEKKLFQVYKSLKTNLPQLLKHDQYEDAFERIKEFIIPMDEFFEKVTVNDNDQHLRQNRLKLLASLCKTVNSLANFNKIEQKR